MKETQEPLVAPFQIFADFREALNGWRFRDLYDAAQPARRLIVPLEYRALAIADYTVEGLPVFFVRRSAADFAAALQQRPNCVLQELKQLRELEESGATCLVVIEGNANEVEQVLTEAKSLTGREFRIPWLFAPTRSVAEMVIFAIIQRAWLQRQTAQP